MSLFFHNDLFKLWLNLWLNLLKDIYKKMLKLTIVRTKSLIYISKM